MVSLAFTCHGQRVFCTWNTGATCFYSLREENCHSPSGAHHLTEDTIPNNDYAHGLLLHKGCHDTKVLLAFTSPVQRAICI